MDECFSNLLYVGISRRSSAYIELRIASSPQYSCYPREGPCARRTYCLLHSQLPNTLHEQLVEVDWFSSVEQCQAFIKWRQTIQEYTDTYDQGMVPSSTERLLKSREKLGCQDQKD
ncbi:hypothetical protein KIN20_037749 [Parelaphostrongylus tenuis]|uniref:Uncharacterized protein n=1 Tax=Parelaphostrongylus tenuis TaxID=148309 RepID=A0AAD5WM72_PARTN|nr:hypothetical protein KIN20_037749 [Parelaphostrongylus tenuis]